MWLSLALSGATCVSENAHTFLYGVMGATVDFVGRLVRRPTKPLSHPSRHQELHEHQRRTHHSTKNHQHHQHKNTHRHNSMNTTKNTQPHEHNTTLQGWTQIERRLRPDDVSSHVLDGQLLTAIFNHRRCHILECPLPCWLSPVE